ncbi:ABC transporter permease [Phaeodactylibacter luteus]|nr:FtsX-like permease family protein [Phaeodactylibacter luteus]
MMIWIMAWRNIWRSPTRSGVVIAAIALGVWAALALTGFATGMMKSYVKSAIEQSVSHIQIHEPGFTEDYEAKYTLPDVAIVAQVLDTTVEVQAYSLRTVVSGMAASGQGARGVMVKGVDPEQEAAVSTIPEGALTAGEFLPEMRGNAAFMGSALAQKLGLKERSKFVLTFQDEHLEITSAAFRVMGLFDSGNTPYDEATLYVRRSDLNRLLQGGPEGAGQAHEAAVLLKDVGAADQVAGQLRAVLPNLDVQTYREIAPDLELYESQLQNVSLIYLAVILLALVFGIINTMLMAVLERVRELGMLMAIGMNRGRVFAMIVLETLALGLLAAPAGLVLGYLTVSYVGKYGIDMSGYSEGMASYGLAQVIYFEVPLAAYWQMGAGVFVTAVLASLYPAWKAIRLQPVEALRAV